MGKSGRTTYRWDEKSGVLEEVRDPNRFIPLRYDGGDVPFEEYLEHTKRRMLDPGQTRADRSVLQVHDNKPMFTVELMDDDGQKREGFPVNTALLHPAGIQGFIELLKKHNEGRFLDFFHTTQKVGVKRVISFRMDSADMPKLTKQEAGLETAVFSGLASLLLAHAAPHSKRPAFLIISGWPTFARSTNFEAMREVFELRIKIRLTR